MLPGPVVGEQRLARIVDDRYRIRARVEQVGVDAVHEMRSQRIDSFADFRKMEADLFRVLNVDETKR